MSISRNEIIEQLTADKKVELTSIPNDIIQMCTNPHLNYYYLVFQPWKAEFRGKDISCYRSVFQNAFAFYISESDKRHNPTSLIHFDIIGNNSEYLEFVMCSSKELSSPSKAMQLFSSSVMESIPFFGERVKFSYREANRVLSTVGYAQLQKSTNQIFTPSDSQSQTVTPSQILAFMGFLLSQEYSNGNDLFRPISLTDKDLVLKDIGEIVVKFMK